MSIHFSNFAEKKETTFSPPETRTIGTHMRIDLNQVSTDSLQSATAGLNAVLDDLKENLGDARFSNEFYIRLLNLNNVFFGTWINRVKNENK